MRKVAGFDSSSIIEVHGSNEILDKVRDILKNKGSGYNITRGTGSDLYSIPNDPKMTMWSEVDGNVSKLADKVHARTFTDYDMYDEGKADAVTWDRGSFSRLEAQGHDSDDHLTNKLFNLKGSLASEYLADKARGLLD